MIFTLILIVAVAGILLLLHMLRLAFLNQVLRHDLCFSDFPESLDGYTIFFISDIHKRRISDKVIRKIKGKANVVIIGGDLTEQGVPLRRVKENLIKLSAIGPVYFVWGNNDYETDVGQLRSLFDTVGVSVLENTAAIVQTEEGESLSILGVDDVNQNRDRIDLAILEAPTPTFKILISHYPRIVHKIRPEQGIRLVLSGHTHGGQIRVFGYGPFKPGGIEKIGSTYLFVSNGYGTTGVPFRLGAPAQCHFIVLRRGVES